MYPSVPGNHQIALGLDALAYLDGGHGVRVYEIHSGKCVIGLRLVRIVGDDLLLCIVGAQKLEHRQQRRGSPVAETSPAAVELARVDVRLVLQAGAGGVHRNHLSDTTTLSQQK